MTSVSNFGGRPPVYPFSAMGIGETADIPAPTPADVKRIAKNASQYGQRHDRFYRCRTDLNTRVMTITRIR